jgi:hypothetical protein
MCRSRAPYLPRQQSINQSNIFATIFYYQLNQKFKLYHSSSLTIMFLLNTKQCLYRLEEEVKRLELVKAGGLAL